MKDPKNILVPTDFSRTSRVALDYAIQFARKNRSQITLLHVVPSRPSAFAGAEDLALEEELKRGGAEQLSKLVKALTSKSVPIDIAVRFGNPTMEIVHAARELRSDLIVLCSHRRRGLQHLLRGSVGKGVIQHAPCPVFLLGKREHELLSPIDKWRPMLQATGCGNIGCGHPKAGQQYNDNDHAIRTAPAA